MSTIAALQFIKEQKNTVDPLAALFAYSCAAARANSFIKDEVTRQKAMERNRHFLKSNPLTNEPEFYDRFIEILYDANTV